MLVGLIYVSRSNWAQASFVHKLFLRINLNCGLKLKISSKERPKNYASFFVMLEILLKFLLH